jgi:hypothetical protein
MNSKNIILYECLPAVDARRLCRPMRDYVCCFWCAAETIDADTVTLSW